MAKLTKQQFKAHNQAVDLLKKDKLTFEDKLFVLANWREDAESINSQAGAFFTPIGLARDMTIECGGAGTKYIDLCAGIGSLSFAVTQYMDWTHDYNGRPCENRLDLTCVEFNPKYIEVGKKIVPNARWIQGSIFDVSLDTDYDCAVSNPPFGHVKTGVSNSDGLGGFEFSTIKKASEISKYGVMILPQQSTPFRYSGRSFYEEQTNTKVERFIAKTGIQYLFNCGIDCNYYKDDWRGVSPTVEICTFEFK